MASAAGNLLDELQSSLAHDSLARRVETLRRVTDLFVGGCVDYSDEQIPVFDDVFACLIARMETAAKAVLANRLAPIASAPPGIMRALAFDDLIEVAGPALALSQRLDDQALIDNVRSRSQQHMLAISTRGSLSHRVTDALLERGDDAVVRSTAANPGAAFSDRGFSTLVTRAEADDGIASCVGLRPDIPRRHYLKLIAKASAAVRAQLEAAKHHPAADVSLAIGEVNRRARALRDDISPHAAIAHDLVRLLYNDGRLDEAQVAAFADAEKFDEASAAIACLAQVSVGLAESIMIESRVEGVFILTKVCGFAWPTVQSIIAMRAKLSNLTQAETSEHRECYERLRTPTAQQVLRFHRMQQSSEAFA